MRLSTLLRKHIPMVPLRAGVPPTWDRPDPPASKKFQKTRRFTMEEKHFYFFDAASPTYMLVNSQVAEGDLIEAFPMFIKRIGIWFLAAFLFGGVAFLWSSKPKIPYLATYPSQVDDLATYKTLSENKYGLKDLQNNPWKVNVWPESFPHHQMGESTIGANYYVTKEAVEAIRQINKEGLAYWDNLHDRVAADIKKSKEGKKEEKAHH